MKHVSILAVVAAATVALTGCATSGDDSPASHSTSSSTSAHSKADDADEAGAIPKGPNYVPDDEAANEAKRKSMEEYGDGPDEDAPDFNDEKFAKSTDIINKDMKGIDSCETEKMKSMYDGKPYTVTTCWLKGMGSATVTAATGPGLQTEEYPEPEDDPEWGDTAIYYGNEWWMSASTEYILKQYLPESADKDLIVTWDDVMEYDPSEEW